MKYTEYTIDWHSIHPRFKWVAIDENGKIYAYVDKPKLGITVLFGGVWVYSNDGIRTTTFIGKTTPPDDFTKCLYERPTMDEKEKAGLTRVYNHLQEMEAKRLKKQLQKIEKENE